MEDLGTDLLHQLQLEKAEQPASLSTPLDYAMPTASSAARLAAAMVNATRSSSGRPNARHQKRLADLHLMGAKC